MEKNGYTLIEITVVVAIIGVLAVVALPKITATMDKIRNEEAIVTLTTIYMGQRDFFRDTGGYDNSSGATAINAALGIDIPPDLNHFTAVAAIDPNAAPPLCSQRPLASVTADSGDYLLYIGENGLVFCGLGGVCNVAYCQKMGYQDPT